MRMSPASGLVVGHVDPALASVLEEAGVAAGSTEAGRLDAAAAPPDLVLLPFSAARGADTPVAEVRRRFPGASLLLVVPASERVAASAAARELDAALVVLPIERRAALATIERAIALRARRREIETLAARIRAVDAAAADAVIALGNELAEKTRAIDEALAFRTSALANLVHEVRTPLTVLQGFADLLEEDLGDRIDADQRELVRGVRSSAAQLGTVVGGLVDLARAESGRLAARTASVFLPDLLAESARALEPELRTRPIRFVLDVDRRLGWIRTEPDWLRQILACLLSNAIKFTAAGEVRLSARVAVPRVGSEAPDAASLLRAPDDFGDAVELAVSDSGCGIPHVQQSRIFDAFHQEDPSTTRRHEGLGIGLTIVRELARALGASLDLESIPGEGTTVRLRIPVDLAMPAAPAPVVARSVRSGTANVDRMAEIATLHRLAPTRLEEAVPLALRAVERSLGASVASYAMLAGADWQVVEAIGDDSAAEDVPRALLEEAAQHGRATADGAADGTSVRRARLPDPGRHRGRRLAHAPGGRRMARRGANRALLRGREDRDRFRPRA
jgi:signal transduction histidine kinase